MFKFALRSIVILLLFSTIEARRHHFVRALSGDEFSWQIIHRRAITLADNTPQSHLQRRQEAIAAESSTDPVQAAKDVQQIPYLANNVSGVTDWASQIVQGDSDESQLPWNTAVPFIQTPSTTASPESGWQAIPQMEGFNLNRSWEVIPGAIMPFYQLINPDLSQIKRAIITWPGKPRDAWKYGNLFRNALNVVSANETYGISNSSVMIITPVWMNQLDKAAGSVLDKELYFHGSTWQAGGASIGPNTTKTRISTYEVMDCFTDMLFNTAYYPNLNQVVVAGHSMGGQATHRYAILKKEKKYDNNMQYWVGNPGSYTYLSPDRPYHNDSCTATYDTWHYGIGGNTTKIPKYAREDVVVDKNAIMNRYLNRKIHMALGLLDNGPGDTHCEALDQGGNHLDRGSQYVLHLASLNNGVFPQSQTVDFIGNTSHQDYAMVSANQTLHWVFANDYDVRYPDIKPFNPSERPHRTKPQANPKQKSYATHGNKILATAMLGGSLVFIILFYTILPFIFTSNFDEDAFNASICKGLANANSGASDFLLPQSIPKSNEKSV